MWNKGRSIRLSKICIYIFALIGVVICSFMPLWLKYVVETSYNIFIPNNLRLGILLLLGYPLAAVCFRALFDLHGLLTSIEKGEVFIQKNCDRLRGISWLCMIAAFICLIGSLFYYQLVLLFCIGAFIGLVLRIVKNVFASAVAIKEENDFTI